MKTLREMALRIESLRGLKTAWLEGGNRSGDLTLLIHGYMDTPDSWSSQARAFVEDRGLVIPFGRGIGESLPPPNRRRYGAYSILLDHLQVLRLADPEGTRPVHIVGHDIGGVHAWMLACHPHPRIRSVTIINSAHPRQYLRRIMWPRQIFKSWYLAALQVPVLAENLLWLFRKEVFRTLTAEGWRSREMSVADFEGAALNAMNEYRQWARDIPEFLRDAPGPTGVPILVISSEDDRYLEAPNAGEFADIASNVVIRVVRGGHWVHAQQPERINRLLEEFWRKHGGHS